MEQGLSRVERRRLAGTHHPVDVDQGLLANRILVDLQCVADIGTDIDVIDIKRRNLVESGFLEQRDRGLSEFVTRLDIDLARLQIHHVERRVAANQFVGLDAQRLEALLGELAGETRGDLAPRFHHHFAGLGIDEVKQRLGALDPLGIELGAPAVLFLAIVDTAVEIIENLLARQTKRVEQRGCRELAAPVDPHEHDILRVELEIEPRTAIGNDARGEQQLAGRVRLAFVMIEEHAG